MKDFPIIDISPWTTASTEERKALALHVDLVCRQTGFLAITGHRVPAEITSAVWEATLCFFDLPLEKKLEVKLPYVDYPYGYAPLQAETLARSLGHETLPDLKESFSTGPINRQLPSNAYAANDAVAAFRFARNQWPREPVEFKAAWSKYYRAMEVLAATLMRIFAVALDLPESFFDEKIDRHISAMRALNYPDIYARQTGQLRAGAHSDYGSLTILLTEPALGGLEICTPDKNWREVPVVPRAFIVNIGDLMARWTNDRWVSTLHRVVNPTVHEDASTRRQSIAFFHQPNWDAEIVCIPTCLAPGEKPKYAPVTSGAHLMEKFRRAVIRNEELAVGDSSSG